MAGELAGFTEALALRLGPEAIAPPPGAHLGVAEGAVAACAAAVALGAPGPVLLVAAPGRAPGLVEELAALLPPTVPVARLPEAETLNYELARERPGATLERGRALDLVAGTERAVVVATAAALAEHRARPGGAPALVAAVGDRMSPMELATRLEASGYGVQHLADEPGTVARRGGIVDVFGAQATEPIRIEFFGDEIESIRRVDIATQRSLERVEAVSLLAPATGGGDAREAAARLLDNLEPDGDAAERFVQEVAVVASGGRTEFEGIMEMLLSSHPALDHVGPDATVLVENLPQTEEQLHRLDEQANHARVELSRRGTIPDGLPALREPAGDFIQRLRSDGRVRFLDPFGSEDLGARRLPLKPAPTFAGRLKVLAAACNTRARAGGAVVIASQQALRLADIFEEEGIHADIRRTLPTTPPAGSITLVPLAIASGLEAPDGLVIISDTEIFGFRKRRKPTSSRKSVRADLVATLEIGDYLVHADHGIARYGGLLRRSVEGIEREYLELQYAEGDRLYVPADQLEAVTQYVGPSDHPPSLTRLGSQDWQRARRKVKQAVLEMAAQLLQLYARREAAAGFSFGPDNAWQMEMEAAFPFVETPEQLAAINDVKQDMERTRPMDRLICGDVGYGKTEVAVRAAFKATTAGKQVAVLVPTTILAEQHGETFRERLAGFPVRVEVLSRFRSEHEQREIVAGIGDGSVDILVGTHRLLQRDVAFKDLGLVVVDEEQRFGVGHKERLRELRAEVDTLTLSATPIPRTLQMSLTGIRDMSTIMTPPEERQPIRTYVLGWDDEIIREAIEREMARGGQVYFVHNRVMGIERTMRRIQELVPDARVAIGHGQMPEEQLERVMLEFGAGDHDVLVCTTIIESGLDIPNANTIIVNNADMFGLAQLYQLRGRVGRSANQAYAYLVFDRDRAMTETAQKRLEAVFEASELGAGFQIALRDLEIRGAGNVLGAEQSGHIAAVGFELYSRLMAEAVAAIKSTLPDAGPIALPPPVPRVDLPLSAHIPENYIEDIHDRLNVYQRIAAVDSAEGIATMQGELRDRFGVVPPAVENLLFVSLVRSVGRHGNVESVKTDEHMFHIRVRGGVTPEAKARVEALKLKGIVTGPNQVRIDRVGHAADWQTVLVRILRALAG